MVFMSTHKVFYIPLSFKGGAPSPLNLPLWHTILLQKNSYGESYSFEGMMTPRTSVITVYPSVLMVID